MDVTKNSLLRELGSKAELHSIDPEITEKVTNALISAIQEHVRKGDTLKIDDLVLPSATSPRDYGAEHGYRSRRSRKRRSGRSNTELHHYSNNFLINELSLLVHDGDYVISKTMLFLRNSFFVFFIVLLYYFLTTLAGC